jgi:hypothetical protein
MRRRRFPILFWSSVLVAVLFGATVVLVVVVCLVRGDRRGIIAATYAGVFFSGVMFLATPFLLLADVVMSRFRFGTWPWKPPPPKRPDT